MLDDSQSYDVYTQIARLVKDGPSSGPNPFAGLDVRDVYAGGASQSATFLMRYYNGLPTAGRAYATRSRASTRDMNSSSRRT